MRAPTPSLKARALRLLAQREHSRSELRRKLLTAQRRAEQATRRDPSADRHGSAGAPPDESAHDDSRDVRRARAVDEVLDWLEAAGWLSASRFVESRVHARAPRFGIRRIEAELARHGLEADARVATTLRSSEPDRARAVWAQKFGRPPVDARDRARQMRFLAGRGFAPEVIRRIVPKAADGTGPDED